MHRGLIAMAAQVEKKQVFPRLVFERPGFDLAQVNISAGEGLKHPMEYSRLVLNREHQRSLIVAAWLRGHLSDHQKARNVGAQILNICGDDLEVVHFLGESYWKSPPANRLQPLSPPHAPCSPPLPPESTGNYAPAKRGIGPAPADAK